MSAADFIAQLKFTRLVSDNKGITSSLCSQWLDMSGQVTVSVFLKEVL